MYNHIIIDVVNVAYTLFKSPTLNLSTNTGIITYDSKKFYGNFVKAYMEFLNFIETKFLVEDGSITCLFDNYHSREELKELLQPLKPTKARRDIYSGYKAGRISEKKEFYNSLDFVKWLMLLGKSNRRTAKIPHLEADDLVKPCLELIFRSNPDSKVLLVTNDSDWCRYLSTKVDYLPNLYENPSTRENFISRWGFEPMEETIILYKILNGDEADKIKMVFPEINPEKRSYIVKNYNTVIDFLIDGVNDPILKDFSKLITDRVIAVKVAYQVLSAIKVNTTAFEHIWTKGRNAVRYKILWDKLFKEMRGQETQFTFK